MRKYDADHIEIGKPKIVTLSKEEEDILNEKLEQSRARMINDAKWGGIDTYGNPYSVHHHR